MVRLNAHMVCEGVCVGESNLEKRPLSRRLREGERETVSVELRKRDEGRKKGSKACKAFEIRFQLVQSACGVVHSRTRQAGRDGTTGRVDVCGLVQELPALP